MRIKKVSQTTPTQAQVVDGYSTSTTDSYSANYVNKLNTYSTDEVRIGTWIDGKPLYRKVFTFIVPAGTSDVWHPFTTSTDINADTIVNIDGFFTYSDTNAWRKVGGSEYPSGQDISRYIKVPTAIAFQGLGSTVDRNMVAIVEYTKTTD